MVEIMVDVVKRNLALFYRGQQVKGYPVAIGKTATPTPLGGFEVVSKGINPGGILGTRLLKLNSGGLAIHGTTDPSSIGRAISNGCIRMYNRDIEEIFPAVPVGTTVNIIKSEALPDDIYIVHPGDNLWNIAKRYGISSESIAKTNNLSDPHVLYPGQQLIIPKF